METSHPSRSNESFSSDSNNNNNNHNNKSNVLIPHSSSLIVARFKENQGLLRPQGARVLLFIILIIKK